MAMKLPFERGPKGDHGQHGDKGDAGAAGHPGERGAAGVQGERGPVGDLGRPGQPGQAWRFSGWSAARLMAFVLVAVVTMFTSARTFRIADENRVALQQIKVNQKRIDEEGVERRDQICLSAEREHLRDVTSLKNTYAYLINLKPEDANSSLNRAIALQLPQTEEKAHTDVAPNFCDEPGVKAEALFKKTHGRQGKPPVGLPEPDPVVPKRPAKVTKLYKDARAQLNN